MSGSVEAPVAQECVEGYLFADPPLELLLFRRPPARGSIWVPVSGKVEPEDPDLPAALRRELTEEAGAREVLELLDLDWHVRFEGPDGGPWRLHAYGVRVPRSFTPTLSPEHDGFAWVSPEEAVVRLHYEDNRAAVERLRIHPRRSAPTTV